MAKELLIWIARAWVAILVIASVMPFIPTGFWAVRLCSFPRVQLVVLSLIGVAVVIAIALTFGWRVEQIVLLCATLAVGIWQFTHVLPYTPLWPTEVDRADAGEKRDLRVFVVNLMYDNDQYQGVLEMIEDVDPTVLLLIEIDQAWDEALSSLHARYPHREGVVREEGVGIALWSKTPLSETEIRYLVSDRRASIFTTLEGPGDAPLRFVGVHPIPPGLDSPEEAGREDSRERDAELVLVAREIQRDPDARWIVAGDFNDVAWSHTTRLFKRLSGLRDPRVGRSLLNTYHAAYPLLRYPIDHVFISDGLEIGDLERRRTPGSDHFAVFTDLVLERPIGTSPSPNGGDREQASEIVEEGKEDAREGG